MILTSVRGIGPACIERDHCCISGGSLCKEWIQKCKVDLVSFLTSIIRGALMFQRYLYWADRMVASWEMWDLEVLGIKQSRYHGLCPSSLTIAFLTCFLSELYRVTALNSWSLCQGRRRKSLEGWCLHQGNPILKRNQALSYLRP